MAYIAWTSQYLAELNLAAGDQTRVEALIDAAGKSIDKYLRRKIEQAEYDDIYWIKGDGTIFLRAYPVDRITRILSNRQIVLHVTSSAVVSSFATSSTALTLTTIVNGSRTNVSLAYATYPSLTLLVAAINATSTWSADLAGGFGAYPSADLMAGQTGLGNGSPVNLWTDTSSPYECDCATGMVRITDTQYWLATGSFNYPQFYNRCRVVWTGGYSTVPTDLQRVCAELVKFYWDSKAGLINSETLGEYSYSLADVNLNRLPVSTRKILDSYKSRIV